MPLAELEGVVVVDIFVEESLLELLNAVIVGDRRVVFVVLGEEQVRWWADGVGLAPCRFLVL